MARLLRASGPSGGVACEGLRWSWGLARRICAIWRRQALATGRAAIGPDGECAEIGRRRARPLLRPGGEYRGEVPADVSPYVRENDVVRMALRRANNAGAGEAEWLRFIRQLEGKE